MEWLEGRAFTRSSALTLPAPNADRRSHDRGVVVLGPVFLAPPGADTAVGMAYPSPSLSPCRNTKGDRDALHP